MMKLLKNDRQYLLRYFVTATVVLCSTSCDGLTPKPDPDQTVGEKPAEKKYDQFKLQIDGRNALDGKATVVTEEAFFINGEFRIIKPYKGRPPVGAILVVTTGPYKNLKEVVFNAGADTVKYTEKQRATFSCKINRAAPPGVYTLKVMNLKEIIMESKLTIVAK